MLTLRNNLSGGKFGLRRPNRLKNSGDFTQAAWTKFQTATLAVDATGPDGKTSAVTLTDDSGGGSAGVYIQQALSLEASQPAVFGVRAKADGLSWLHLRAVGFTSPATGGVYFNLSTGAIGTESAGYTGTASDEGGGWYFCSIAFTLGAGDTAGNLRIQLAEANDDLLVPRDGTSTVLIYGAQAEVGASFARYSETA